MGQVEVTLTVTVSGACSALVSGVVMGNPWGQAAESTTRASGRAGVGTGGEATEGPPEADVGEAGANKASVGVGGGVSVTVADGLGVGVGSLRVGVGGFGEMGGAVGDSGIGVAVSTTPWLPWSGVLGDVAVIMAKAIVGFGWMLKGLNEPRPHRLALSVHRATTTIVNRPSATSFSLLPAA
jgi:hypothetical protein